MIFIYTTAPSVEAGKKLAAEIIDKKFASAVNIWPTQSIFSVKGERREGEGAVLFIRTLEKRLQDLEDLISAHHAPAIACVAAMWVDRLNRNYKEHLAETIG